MDTTQQFKIYPIGITDDDKKKLKRALRISSGSIRNYTLTDTEGSRSETLFLVNSDSDKAIAYWCKRYLNSDKTPDVATAFIGRRKVKGKQIYNLDLPIKATQILSTLDTMTAKELNFIPELTIGANSDKSNLSNGFLEKIAKHSALESSALKPSLYNALVVDDNATVRKQLEIELNLLNVKVELAENGDQAINLCRSNQYDIIYLDVVMPGMDGYKVCKHLKKFNLSKSAPIVMLTGKSSPFDKARGSLSGCSSYLTKPLERKKFQKITQKYLKL
ncbi:hypothetical protein MNBD_GAMMA06-319 [hydrothermal vent metagenome]|uniref:Response regulatory domain-containing protein n=1 Tax=hydrothermal vent metagenome TaxID=652676 RepID=A0A3B0WGU7_9ZZZZ